jgi:flagellar hook assembly protein FlgD
MNSKTEIMYTPQLGQGGHILSVAVTDLNDNNTQTEIGFSVVSGSRIEEFYPIPNPFSDKTWFTYKLTSNFDDISIKIYTVRGRLIRVIDYLPAVTGFNRVEWDGHDQDGDKVANGVYICRIIGRINGKTSVLQTKAAVIR